MARVTIEDCIDKLPNRFELVLLAAHRARLLSQGAPLTVDRDRDKDPVVALREIAAELKISEHTVGNHLRAIYRALHINKRSQLQALLRLRGEA